MSAHPCVPALAPELAAIGKRWQEAGVPDLYQGCLDPLGAAASRERARNIRAFLYPKPQLPMGPVRDVEIDGPHGSIRARIHQPHPDSVTGPVTSTLVYFHGGGWVLGDIDSHEMHAVRLANEAQCVVLNVDYRLAPEHKAPCAFDDCWAATQWAATHISELGGARARLAVGGDSAGGNLAAAVAVAARDAGLALAAQLLLYPATDLSRQRSLPEEAYLGHDYERWSRDPRVSPIFASLKGVAPVILGVGPHDFLYRDNLAYAQALREAGVPLLYREYPTLNHGFFSYTAISQDSLAAAQQLCQDLRAHFDHA
jgi:acetyl esterase/lipase